MAIDFRRWLGMGGVPPRDHPEAYVWERRLHWVMVAIALLAIPSFYLEIKQNDNPLAGFGLELDLFIFLAFSLETLWMSHVCRHKWLYLKYNWLNVVIIIGSGLGMAGLPSEWLPLVRLLRIAYVTLALARMLTSLRLLLSAKAVPYAFVLGIVTLLASGAGFYWLEPTIHSFGEGLWLAFITGATVGYGDFVPTTTAARVFAVIMVIVGVAVFSLVTASVSAFFVGEDEKKLRREMHHDIQELRREIAELRSKLQSGEAVQPAARKEPD
ncbi:MAG: potassium channel family protein [Sulfurimicrobium sp.]|jgi:voltage-gated potassium channel|nr:potassium channel family protein [Sulfurimicrobium sp.]MDO9189924.1 potassium channel family protein [Sulfurimicrobium sp.]MDP1706133.1 potassium channel family protein [Sulfurimicrobium sp.]MDP1898435.1 potassium channel family protein [Sulfurimicrobium sp.]MDP2197056.1 potassium channel family protein [Sulfurimicrobium sp.]